MWLDAIALLLLGVFVGMGALRGALASFLGLASLGLAYAAALVAAPRLGPPVAETFGLPEPLGMPLAGTAAFLVTYLLAGIASAVLRRLERRGHDVWRSPRDRFLGGVFGAVRGGLVVLLLAWLALWVDALRVTGTVESLPSIEGSSAAALTESVIEAGVEAALEDSGPAARLVASAAARPGRTLGEFQSLLEDSRIGDLQRDRMFWTYVENGAVDAAMNRSSMLAMSRDPALRQRLADLGLVDAAAADDPRAFRAEMRAVLEEVGPRIRRLREDPELQRMLEDPEVASMLQQGDTLGLMTHRGFRQLVARAASSPR